MCSKGCACPAPTQLHKEGRAEVNKQKGIQNVFGEAGRKAREVDPKATSSALDTKSLQNTALSPVTVTHFCSEEFPFIAQWGLLTSYFPFSSM